MYALTCIKGMSYNSEKVKRWRTNLKSKIVEGMGGKCCICGYDKCHSALALHHLDPSKKDFQLSKVRASPKKWSAIVNEIKKCILVCHNCHSEIHEGITKIPKSIPKFKEISYDDLKNNDSFDNCPVCGNKKPKHYKTCSRKCSAKLQFKVDWDSVNLKKELKTKSYEQIAKELGCSGGAVHKRAKKLGLK